MSSEPSALLSFDSMRCVGNFLSRFLFNISFFLLIGTMQEAIKKFNLFACDRKNAHKSQSLGSFSEVKSIFGFSFIRSVVQSESKKSHTQKYSL